MKILITGGCGFLGSNLVADALTRGDDVIVFDNLYKAGSRKNLEWLNNSGPIQFEYGDIRNANDIARVISTHKPEAIFHLAGQVAMTTSIDNPRLDFEINAMGTLHLLEAARISTPNTTIIYSSTNKVYGDLEQYTYEESTTRYDCIEFPNGFKEDIPLEFHSPYGCSKGSADQYMQDYARIFGMNTVVFRHSSMYGGRQYATYDQGWVGWFCQQAIEFQKNPKRELFTISGNGKQVRDVLHADDMKALYRSAIENINVARGQVFNIGGGAKNSLSLLELFGVINQALGIKLTFETLPVRISDQRFFVADIEKAQQLMGWSPKISYKEGINQMLSWTLEQNQ